MTLRGRTEKRDEELARRVAALGPDFTLAEVGTSRNRTPKSYTLYIDVASDPNPIGWKHFSLDYSGLDELEAGTADTEQLRRYLYDVRYRYHTGSHRENLSWPRELLSRAERDYGQAVARLAVFILSGSKPTQHTTLKTLQADVDEDYERLKKAVKVITDAEARIEAIIGPRP